MTSPTKVEGPALAGVVLAGGLGRRLGGVDKALLPLGGAPLVAHVARRLAAQVGAIAINANGDAGRFAGLDLPVVADPLPDRPGPLAGVLAGMEWAAARGFRAVVTVSTDAPFFPADLVARLQAAAGDDAAIAATAGTPPRMHPTFGLWPVALAPRLRAALLAGDRRMMHWAEACDAATAIFDDPDGTSFLNINTPEDLARAESLVALGTAPT